MKLRMGSAILLFAVMFTCSLARGQYETDKIFPPSTQTYFSVTDTVKFQEQWNKMKLGKALADPKFEPFRKVLASQIEGMWTSRFGLKLEDIGKLASGEVGAGLIALPGKKPGYAIIMDITGKQAQLNEFLTKVIKQATSVKNGEAKVERLVIGNSAIDATVVTVPPDDEFPTERVSWYIDLSTMLLVTDQKYLAELILSQLAGNEQGQLATLPAYVATMKRCLSELPAGEKPAIRFYVNPLEAGEALYSIQEQTDRRRNQPSPYSILAKQGFDGIKGIGGVVTLASENREFITRIKVHIPDPPQKAFNMLTFHNTPAQVLPKWIGDDADRTMLMTIDPLNIFNNFGPLFDEFLETEGAWNDILVSLEKDEDGPRVNLKTDFVAYLGTNLSSMRIYTEPLGETSEKFMFSLDIKPGSEAKLCQVLHRMFDTDPDFRKSEFGSDVIWQYVRPKDGANQSGSTRSRSRRAQTTTPPVAANESQLIKGGAFCVSNGYFFVSNDIEILQAQLKKNAAGEVKSIAGSQKYQEILDIINAETKNTGRFIEGHIYPQRETELNYMLFQQGKFPKKATLLSQLSSYFTKRQENDKQAIDGSSLPPFEEFRKNVGSTGYYGTVEPDGWFIKRFGL